METTNRHIQTKRAALRLCHELNERGMVHREWDGMRVTVLHGPARQAVVMARLHDELAWFWVWPSPVPEEEPALERAAAFGAESDLARRLTNILEIGR